MVWHSRENRHYTSKNGYFFHISENTENATLFITTMHNVTSHVTLQNVEEAKQRAEQLTANKARPGVTTIHGTIGKHKKVFFLSTDHCQESRVPAHFVPVTTYLPYFVTPRPNFETGIIDTKEELTRFLTHNGETEIQNPDPKYQPKN